MTYASICSLSPPSSTPAYSSILDAHIVRHYRQLDIRRLSHTAHSLPENNFARAVCAPAAQGPLNNLSQPNPTLLRLTGPAHHHHPILENFAAQIFTSKRNETFLNVFHFFREGFQGHGSGRLQERGILGPRNVRSSLIIIGASLDPVFRIVSWVICFNRGSGNMRT